MSVRKWSPKQYVVLAMTLTGIASLSPAHAQVTNTQVNVQANPGQIIQNEQRKDIESKGGLDQQKQIQEKPEEIKLDIPAVPEAASAGGSPKFKVNKIEIEGNTVIDQDAVDDILKKYEGQDLSLDDLGKTVNDLNALYRSKGFLTSQAYIPPQDIENGVVKIQIVEGTIGDISISGNRYFRTWAIKRSLPDYENGEVLNIPDLEKTLNRINQQQAFRLKAVLKAGEKTGQTDIDFQVAERQPWQISPTFDNQGRPFVGTMRWGTEVSNQSLFGMGDRLFLKWLMAERTQVAAGSYSVPLNRYGTELGYSYGFSYVDVDLHTGKQPRIQGFSHNHSLTLSQPLDKNRMFTTDASLNVRRVTTYFDGNRGDRDNVRSLGFGLNFNKLDRWGRTFLRLQNDVGIEWLDGDQNFWKTQIFGTRLQRLPLGMTLILRGSGQFTPDSLPPVEQYQIGGAFSVRGYTEGLITGDSGYNLGAEVRFPIPGLKKVSPWLGDRIQGAYFMDVGQAWLDRSNTSYVASNNTRSGNNTSASTFMAGTGFGVRAQLSRFLIGFLDAGFGLTNNREPGNFAKPTARVYFGVRSDLLSDKVTFGKTDESKPPIKLKKKKDQPEETPAPSGS